MQSNGAVRGPDTRNEKELNEGVGQNSNTSTLLPDMVNAQSEDAKAPARGLDGKDIEAINGSGGILARVLSRTQSRSSYIEPGPPPDGGLTAWTQACMTHLVVFNTWGYINSFGVFQTYYVTTLNHPPSAISWVGSVQIFLLFFIGTFSGRATDYGLFRPTFFTGSFLQVLGVFMTSLSTQYWQLFLAQGICTGVGNGLVFCPCLAVLSTYFSKRRSLAIGIGASGTATGGLVFPVIVQQLLPKIGFAWTVRIQAFVMLTVSLITLAFFKPRLPPRKSGPIVEWSAFKELSYDLFTIGMFLIFWALYFAFYYVGSFGRNILHISESSSINDLLIINGIGLFGRLIPNHLADRFFGPLNVIIPFAFISGLLLYCWAAVTSPGGLIGFAVTYGLFAAGIQGLFPSVVASLTTDLKKTGVRMGMVFSAISFAVLTGPPLGGALIQNENGRYLDAQMWAGSALMVGFLMLIASRVVAKGWGKARI